LVRGVKYFGAWSDASRADSARTRPSAELKRMPERGTCLSGFAEKCRAVALGPVADPPGVFGVGLREAPDCMDVAAIRAGDPVIRSGAGFRDELHPMPSLVTRR
jgi:hypothetical protein